MNGLANLLWIIFGGWLIFLIYIIGGLLLCLTIVGIPFGIQAFKMAQLGLFPFGYVAVPGTRASGCLYLFINIIWIFVAGIELACVHLFLAVLCAITIVGIPFAIQHLKLAILGLMPFGHDIRPRIS